MQGKDDYGRREGATVREGVKGREGVKERVCLRPLALFPFLEVRREGRLLSRGGRLCPRKMRI